MLDQPGDVRVDPSGWPAAIADTQGPQLVVAGPGAGKTEFLVRRALHLIHELDHAPEQILVLSFSRRGAADLRERIGAGLDRSHSAIPAATFHSLAMRLLEAHGSQRFGWEALPTLLTKPEQVALVHELLAEERPAEWPQPFRGLLATTSFADEIADFVLRCGERLIGPDELGRRAEQRDDWRALPGFLGRYEARLEARRRLDYGSLQRRAVELLADPEIRSLVAARFPYVLVDEYQDTTTAQARLLDLITAPAHNLTVAGDPYQSIYSFRGAELENIAEFPATFIDEAGRPARRIVLTTSFRVPSAILEAAVRVTAGGRLPGAAGPVVPAPGIGSVETYGFDQQSHEAEWIASEIQRIHLAERIPYRRIAVLVRSKRRFLPELSRALERRGIPHDQPDRRLIDHPAVRTVLDCVRAATGSGAERTGAIGRLLLGPLVSLPLSAWRQTERERIAHGTDWPALLQRVAGDGGALADLVADPSWATRQPAAAGFWHLWTTLPQFAAFTEDRHREDRAALSSLSQVLDRLAERNPAATLADYAAWSADEDFEATPLLEYRDRDEDRLTMTTLHQAKGLAFDIVFVADAVDGVFPDLRLRESLLGVRHLSPNHGGDGAAYARFRLQEEMRLAYTAMSRAGRRVIWTATATGFDEGGGMPSRFLPLVAGVEGLGAATEPPPERTAPVTPLEAEAWLRRLLADPAETPARRLAALTALADAGTRLGRNPTAFAGFRRRGRNDGLLPEHLSLSPSQADDYLSCPWRYAIRRRLHVDADRSVYLSFGILIHTVLETVEREAIEEGLPHADIEAALDRLEEQWRPEEFGGGPWAEAWMRRARGVLEHLYAKWPSSGTGHALEQPVEMVVAGTPWRGRIDRIDRVGGADPELRIVDYKTGSSLPSVEEAARSIQLGFYALAAAADPDLAAAGAVTGAEFWYPAAGLGSRKSVAVRRFDLGRLDEVTGLMAEAADGITSEDWTPRPNPGCDRCPVRLVCPAWPEGREAFSA